MEFKAFKEIKRYSSPKICITQKIHGSNAQILIFKNDSGELDLKCGSRSKFIFPGKTTDNFGFAAFVEQHKQEFIDKLGEGIHYGEWAGPGINSGEGLTEKTLVLFNHGREYPNGLPPKTVLVPVLYNDTIPKGLNLDELISSVMLSLKMNGSKLVEGFMRPEGVVVSINGTLYKNVFQAEETQWTKPSKTKNNDTPKEVKDYTHLCQPIRLEKLLSRDELYMREYPKSLGMLVKDYIADLAKEEQLPTDADEALAVRKNASPQIFKFVKSVIEEKYLPK